MTIVYESENCVVFLRPYVGERDFTDWRINFLKLSSVTFGLANRRIWEFDCYYNPVHNFNVEKPPLGEYRMTPRAVWQDQDLEPDEYPAPFTDKERDLVNSLPVGYDYLMWRQYNLTTNVGPTSEIPYFKIAMDAICRPINEDAMLYVHPEQNRLLYLSELRALAGTEGDPIHDVPDCIQAFIERQARFYENGVWEKDDYCGFYDPFRNGWNEDSGVGYQMKITDFSLYEPKFVHPLSDWESANVGKPRVT